MRDMVGDQNMLMQLFQIPEVAEARKFYEDGKLVLAAQRLERAQEICAASRMPELSFMAHEALAHVYALVGEMVKEQYHREMCVEACAEIAAKSPSPATNLGLFDSHLSACITDMKLGMFETVTLHKAKKYAGRLGKDGPAHQRAAELVEALSMLAGSNPTSESEDILDFLLDRVESCEKDCTQFPTLIATAHILLGMAYKRLGDDRVKDSWETAVNVIDNPTSDSEASIKIAGLRRLAHLAIEQEDLEAAHKHATEALKLAESARLPSLVTRSVYTNAKVRMAAGDFVVAEGLLRSCIARLVPVSGRQIVTWDLLDLQDITQTYCGLLEKLTINNQSRKAEADLQSQKLTEIEAKHEVTAQAVESLRASLVEQCFINVFLPNIPLLLQAQY